MSWDAVFFDLDDTLYSRRQAFSRTAHRFVELHVSSHIDGSASSHVSQIVEWDSTKHMEAGSMDQRIYLFSKIKANYPWISEPADELVRWYQGELARQLKLDCSAKNVLTTLNESGVPWGLITNGDLFQLKKLQILGIEVDSERVVMSEIVGWRKPDRRIFEYALTRLDISQPDNVLMVGDNPIADILGGRDAGLKTAWMKLGRTWEHSDYRPDFELDSLADLIRHL